MSDEIWSKVKQYRNAGANGYYFPRFLFVSIDDLTAEDIQKISEEDEKVITSECMRDKSDVFDVVYNRTEHNLGGDIEVEDKGQYLLFKTKQDHDEAVAT